MKPVKPIVTREQEGTVHEYLRSEHPAFGVVTVGRVSCKPSQYLFGSSLPQRDYIELRFYKATGKRNYHDHDTRQGECVMELAMTELQWSQFVASAGIGAGTPVTYHYVPKGTLQELPGIAVHEELHQTFSREIEEACDEYVSKAKELLEKLDAMLQDKSIKKSDLVAVRSEVRHLAENMPSNMGFMMDQFSRAIEATVTEGRAALDAHAHSVLLRTGVDVHASPEIAHEPTPARRISRSKK